MPTLDDMRRAFGIRTQHDRDAVARDLAALDRDQTPAGRLARGIADATVPREQGRRPLPDGLVRIMLPDLTHDPRPLQRDPDLRRLQIAGAARTMIDRHLEHGSDQRLGADLGRAVRTETVRGTSGMGMSVTPLDRLLDRRSEATGRNVAAYLAHGPKVEAHHRDVLRAIPERGAVRSTVERLEGVRELHPDRAPPSGAGLGTWVERGLRIERAMARGGLIAPDRVVRAANAVMQGTPDATVASLAAEPRARPDFEAAARLEPSARRELAKGWLATAERPTPAAAGREDAGVGTKAVEGRAVSAAMIAGMAGRGQSI